MAPRTRASKRQTRLDFAPFPISSPNRTDQPEAVRSRAAAVTINPPLRKKRKTNNSFLPTPVASSQPKDGDTADAANDVEMVQERSSSPDAPVIRSSFMGRGCSGKRQPFLSPSTPKSSANVALTDTLDGSESDAHSMQKAALPPRRSRRNKDLRARKLRKVKSRPERDNPTSESDEVESPKPASSRTGKRPVVISDDDDGDSGDNKPTKGRKGACIEPDDSDSDIIPTKLTRRAKLESSTPKRNAQEDDDLREDLEFLRDSSESNGVIHLPM